MNILPASIKLEGGKFDALKLRNSQLALYIYLKSCVEQKKRVDFWEVAEIYYTKVKDPEAFMYSGRLRQYYIRRKGTDHPYVTLKCKDAVAFLRTYHKTTWKGEVRMWLRSTVGSLVMRGLFEVVPKFDASLIEQGNEKA